MPTPTRITKTRSYENGAMRLDPPAPGAQPKVAASVVWAHVRAVYRVAKYEIVLTSYSGLYPLGPKGPGFVHRLAWVVIGSHVPSVGSGGAAPLPGVTTVPQPPCFFETQLTLFDANTGQELEEATTG